MFRPLAQTLTLFFICGFAFAEAGDFVIRAVQPGWAIFERNDFICIFARPGDEELGRAGGFFVVLKDLSEMEVLGNPPEEHAIEWRWIVSDGADGALRELTPAFERSGERETARELAALSMQNAWLDPDSGEAVLLESVGVYVNAQQPQSRTIDVNLQVMNVSPEPLRIAGGQSGSGFLVRPSALLEDIEISVLDSQRVRFGAANWSPWFAMNYQDERRSTFSSYAIFQHPDNEGTSAPNLYLDESGLALFGHSDEGFAIKPGERVSFQFRIYIDSRELNSRRLEQEYALYVMGAEPVEAD